MAACSMCGEYSLSEINESLMAADEMSNFGMFSEHLVK